MPRQSAKKNRQKVSSDWGDHTDFCDSINYIQEHEALQNGCEIFVEHGIETLTYGCCVKFNATKERTLHILSHYIEGDLQLDDIRKEIARFAKDNCDWIEAASKPSLDAFGCKMVNDYIDALLEGTVVLDQLAVLLFVSVFKIHCVIILNGRFWSTRSDFNHNACQIKLAFTGAYSYKEFRSVEKKVDEKDVPASDEDDLQGTGLMSGEDSGDSEQETSDTNEIEVIVLSSDDEDYSNASAPDNKDSVLVQVKNEPDSEEEIQEISADEMDVTAKIASLQDVIPFKAKRVDRTQPYICQICMKTLHQQVTFVKHMETDHPGQAYSCERCDAEFSSKNGFFKHIRSHLYLKYQCSVCGFRVQFPYQYNSHIKTHKGLNLITCGKCSRAFASKTSMQAHEKMHDTSISCDQCPASDKTFNSEAALNIHKRGKHGNGWDTYCSKNYKWKSKYSRHMWMCNKCKHYKASLKLQRYDFLRDS